MLTALAVMVKVNVVVLETLVGVPLITPVAEFKVTPAATRLPAVTENVTALLSPTVALMVAMLL